jgi:hypothetical protein
MKRKTVAVSPTFAMTKYWAERCQVSGRSPSFHARYPSMAVILVPLIVLAGCGGGGYDANHVSVTVTPAAVTIPTNGQVTLRATVNGLCSMCTPTIYSWSVSADDNGNCEWVTSPPVVPCPDGTIQETEGDTTRLTVTYFAPSTPGTYHIVAGWSPGFGASVTKQGPAVITVSP